MLTDDQKEAIGAAFQLVAKIAGPEYHALLIVAADDNEGTIMGTQGADPLAMAHGVIAAIEEAMGKQIETAISDAIG